MVIKRRSEVADLLAAQVAPRDIEQRISEKYDISPRMVRVDIVKAYELMEQDAAKERPFRRAKMRVTLQQLYQRCMARRRYTAALGALDRLCKLDGLYAAERMEVTTEAAQLTSAQVRDRIDELLKLRAAALDGREADGEGLEMPKAQH